MTPGTRHHTASDCSSGGYGALLDVSPPPVPWPLTPSAREVIMDDTQHPSPCHEQLLVGWILGAAQCESPPWSPGLSQSLRGGGLSPTTHNAAPVSHKLSHCLTVCNRGFCWEEWGNTVAITVYLWSSMVYPYPYPHGYGVCRYG